MEWFEGIACGGKSGMCFRGVSMFAMFGHGRMGLEWPGLARRGGVDF